MAESSQPNRSRDADTPPKDGATDPATMDELTKPSGASDALDEAAPEPVEDDTIPSWSPASDGRDDKPPR